MKNQPCLCSVADSDKSFRPHRAGYFIGQGSIDTALARGRGEHLHRKRWGQKSRTHCMGLGATTIFRIASLLLRFFRQIPWSTSWTHVRSNMPTTSDYSGGLTGGATFTTPFFGFLGKFANCSIILRFCDFFSLLGIIPQKQSRGTQAKDKAEHKAVTPCEPRAPYGHSRRNGIDQGDPQGDSPASMVGRRKRSATRELFSSSRQSQLTDIGKIYTKSPAFFLSWSALSRHKWLAFMLARFPSRSRGISSRTIK